MTPRSVKSISPLIKYGKKYRSLFGYSKEESPVDFNMSSSASPLPNEESDSPFMLWPIELGKAQSNTMQEVQPIVNTIATSPIKIIEVTAVTKVDTNESQVSSPCDEPQLSLPIPIASPIMKVVNDTHKEKEINTKNLITPFDKLTTTRTSSSSPSSSSSSIKRGFFLLIGVYILLLFSSTIRYHDTFSVNWNSLNPILESASLHEVHELMIDVNDEINKMSNQIHDLIVYQLHTSIDNNQNIDNESINTIEIINIKEENNDKQKYLPINTINPDWKDSSFESIFINFT